MLRSIKKTKRKKNRILVVLDSLRINPYVFERQKLSGGRGAEGALNIRAVFCTKPRKVSIS